MYILFDPSDSEQTRVLGVADGERFAAAVAFGLPGANLIALNSVLKSAKKKLTSIKGVAVVAGKGRFSATRSAAVTANILALTLKIPAAAVPAGVIDFEKIVKDGRPGRYVLPSYSGQATIGKKSKNQKSKVCGRAARLSGGHDR